jgi:hypothetical protein
LYRTCDTSANASSTGCRKSIEFARLTVDVDARFEGVLHRDLRRIREGVHYAACCTYILQITIIEKGTVSALFVNEYTINTAERIASSVGRSAFGSTNLASLKLNSICAANPGKPHHWS